MTSRLVGPVLALALIVAACGDGDATSRSTPVPTSTQAAATATAVGSNTSKPTSTVAPTTTGTAAPTNTSAPTNTATPTTTPTPNLRACRDGATYALNQCVGNRASTLRACYFVNGVTCAADDPALQRDLTYLANDVREYCPDDATVRDGFGGNFTVDSLIARFRSACTAEVQSLAGRSFGGPQGTALGDADDAERACLFGAYDAANEFLDQQLAKYRQCISETRDGTPCVPEGVAEEATILEQDLALTVGTACASLPDLISVDPPTYAARAAAQARCLAAYGHSSTAPLDLDCGPRDGLIETPRGRYVQVVLDSDTYGTRCGDGSPFAFWIRLAPDGSPVDRVVVGMQGGGVCIFGEDCATRPATLFEALSDQPETGGPLSNDPQVSPFADWTKVYLPYCNQDVFIGGGATSNFDQITVHRFGGVNVRAAMRYVRDVIWRELDRDTEAGYRPDEVRAIFGGFSAGGFGTIYNYHWVLDDLEWARTAAYPDAGLALDNGELLGVAGLGALLINDTPPLGWGARNLLPSYCTTTDCGVGPVILERMAPRLLQVPEQQMLVLSNQIDETQVGTTFFPSIAAWVNELRASYCETKDLDGVSYFMPAISQNIHVISPRPELYTNYPIDGVLMRDWLAAAFTAPETVTDHVEEGTLVNDYPGVMAFPCEVTP